MSVVFQTGVTCSTFFPLTGRGAVTACAATALRSRLERQAAASEMPMIRMENIRGCYAALDCRINGERAPRFQRTCAYPANILGAQGFSPARTQTGKWRCWPANRHERACSAHMRVRLAGGKRAARCAGGMGSPSPCGREMHPAAQTSLVRIASKNGAASGK